MTAGEVCEALEKLPPHLPVTVAVERELTIFDRTGDRVCGEYSGVFDIESIGMGQAFSLGWGSCSMILLETGDEL